MIEPTLALLILAAFILNRRPAWEAFWAGLMEPGIGGSTPAHRRGATAAWHALLGAAFAAGLPGYWWAAFGVAAVYWTLKEERDWRNGGDLADGIEDAIFVYLGALYGPWWWPPVLLMATGAVALAQVGRE